MHEGLTALELGDEETAHARFVRATEVSAGSSRAWYWRAKTAPSLAEIIRCLERASAVDPTNEKVRSSLAHAVARMAREQERRRFAQPLPPDQVAARSNRGAREAMVGAGEPGPRPDGGRRPASQERSSQPGPLTSFMGQVIGLAYLGLAALWLAAGLLPLARAVAAAPGAAVPAEAVQLSTAYVDAVSGRLSIVPVGVIDATLGSAFGGQASLVIPFVLGFLFLFTASAVLQRDPGGRFWASTLAILQIGLGTMSGSRDTLALTTALGVAVALGLLLGVGGQEGQSAVRTEGRKIRYGPTVPGWDPEGG